MDHGRTLPINLDILSRTLVRCLILLAFLASPAILPVSGATTRADALVLVNSASAKYSDFQHWIQPYLDNFGVPYAVQDLSTNASTANLTNYAVIIIGHKQLDTNHTYLDTNSQAAISYAVSNGIGLVNFDNDLSVGAVPRYQFVQDIFGFNYGNAVPGANVVFPPTEPSSQLHYITALHQANENISL